MTERLDDLDNAAMREALRERGYVYVDETGYALTLTDELPERGWYVYLNETDKPLKLRVTDRPYDGRHVRTDVDRLEEVQDEYRNE